MLVHVGYDICDISKFKIPTDAFDITDFINFTSGTHD